jgi:hypothetical protein
MNSEQRHRLLQATAIGLRTSAQLLLVSMFSLSILACWELVNNFTRIPWNLIVWISIPAFSSIVALLFDLRYQSDTLIITIFIVLAIGGYLLQSLSGSANDEQAYSTTVKSVFIWSIVKISIFGVLFSTISMGIRRKLQNWNIP